MHIGNVKCISSNPSIVGQTIQWPKEKKDKALHRSINTKQHKSCSAPKRQVIFRHQNA
jgi:hypothetical protein